jgi:hypothetical protein
MAPVTPVYPSLRVDRVGLYQGDRQQQSPFKNGAILKGQITGRQGNQFVLEVDGQKLVASTKTPLRVGQNLNLQVTSTRPSITLQILADSLTSQVGKSMHLLSAEGALVPKTLELAAMLPENDLSPPSRQTLAFYKNSTDLLSCSGQGNAPLTGRYGDQIISLLQQALNTENPADLPALRSQLQALLKAFPETVKGSDLVKNILAGLESDRNDLSIRNLLFTAGPETGSAQQLKALLLQLESTGQTGQALAETINRFTGARNELTPTPFLLRLLGLVLNPETGKNNPPQTPLQGKDLKEYIDRVGTSLERLLAEGKTDQAAATLKSALLEIKERHGANEAIARQAGQLNATIEAVQLLQVRLAQDSIFLLPLPFPFLEQGFLVVDQEHPGQSNRGEKKETAARYSLYLQLEGLGNLRIDLQQGTSGTRIFFYAQDPERASFLAQNRNELIDLMTATTPESIQFLAGAEDPVKSLLARITQTGTTVLNTTA